MVERRIFLGDRETAFDYLGDARRLLMVLKNMIQNGGLDQLSRTINYPDGTVIVVSSVFGQDSIAIQAPPAAEGRIRAQVAEETEVVGEMNEEPTPIVLQQNFTDTVFSQDSVAITIIRTPPPVPQPPIVACVGTISGPRAFIYRTDTGAVMVAPLRVGGGKNQTGSFGNAISPDGNQIIGTVFDSNFKNQSLAVSWPSGTSLPIGPIMGTISAPGIMMAIDNKKVDVGGQYEWNGVDGSTLSTRFTGNYSHPSNAALAYFSSVLTVYPDSGGSWTYSIPNGIKNATSFPSGRGSAGAYNAVIYPQPNYQPPTTSVVIYA